MTARTTSYLSCLSLRSRRLFSCAALFLVGVAPGLAQLSYFDFWNLDTSGVTENAESFDRFGAALARGDFNGDGYDDLAIGLPGGEVLGVISNAGRVKVLYGTVNGFYTISQQTLTQGALAPEPVEDSDGFGSALAAGDFDGDGYDDLAVGTPFEDLPGADNAGAVDVFYGSASGLDASTRQLWHQDSPGVPGVAQYDDRFGAHLAVGDFDGDDFEDLAISAHFDDVDGELDAGIVNVIYGTSQGLSGTDSQRFRQGFGGLPETAEAGDIFGKALASGDFDGDGYSDLAIGAHGEDLPAADNVGNVLVVYGSALGLVKASGEIFTEPAFLEDGDRFGEALAAGDFDGDGRDDLAVGTPGEVVGDEGFNEGAVYVFPGAPGGLSAVGTSTFHQDTAGVADEPENNDNFGEVLAAGDLNVDGYDDLVIGAPQEDGGDFGLEIDSGWVQVLHGGPSGLVPNVGFERADAGDEQGSALAIGNFGGGLVLAVGMPGDVVGGNTDAGSVAVFATNEIFLDGFESGTTGRWSSVVP